MTKLEILSKNKKKTKTKKPKNILKLRPKIHFKIIKLSLIYIMQLKKIFDLNIVQFFMLMGMVGLGRQSITLMLDCDKRQVKRLK
jgi:hypothetical protein